MSCWAAWTRDRQVPSLAKGCDWLMDRTELYPLAHFFLGSSEQAGGPFFLPVVIPKYMSVCLSVCPFTQCSVTARTQASPGLAGTYTHVPMPPTVHANRPFHNHWHSLPPALFEHLGSAVGRQTARLAAAFEGAGHGERKWQRPWSQQLNKNAPLSASNHLCHQRSLLGDG